MTSPIDDKTGQLQINQNITSARYDEKELKKLKKACADFETIFTFQLLKTMRKTIPQVKTGISSYGKDTYTMLMDQKLAENISNKGNGLGLQKVLFDQLTNSISQAPDKEVKIKLK